MIKYIGIVMISACTALLGSTMSARLKESLLLRGSVIKLLYAIENGIRYGGTVKKRIYLHFNDEILQGCGFLDRLRNGEITGKDIDECLYLLSKEDRNMLASFFSKLGKSGSCLNEVNNCKRFICEFESAGEEVQKKLKSKIVLYKKLGIICALAAAVIFI